MPSFHRESDVRYIPFILILLKSIVCNVATSLNIGKSASAIEVTPKDLGKINQY